MKFKRLMGIALILISMLIPFIILANIPYKTEVSIYYNSSDYVCTDGCGQILMYEPPIPMFFVIILPLIVIVSLIVYILRYKESDETKR